MFHVRSAHDGDTHYLLDIDIKCFDTAWTPEEWQRLRTTHIVAVVTTFGTPIAFAVFRESMNEIDIPKLAVKRQYRRQRVADMLLCGMDDFARSRGVQTMSILVPEYMTDPETPDDISEWLNHAGFRAQPPFIAEAFTICGEPENGIPFERPIR